MAHATVTQSGMVIKNDSHANKLLMEANRRKLQLIKESEEKIKARGDSHSPQINGPMKKSLYDSETIKKYIQDKNY
jgi:hypothetical protein